jgi:hypothetical protein
VNRFLMHLVCISAPSSTPWSLKISLFTMYQSS